MPNRILIVEDEEDNLVLLIHILKMVLGQEQVFVARDGHEAIQQAYLLRPNVILMDLTLPKLDGWEATRSLKSDRQFKDTAILALTAHAMVGARELALEAGCDDYFAKPIELDRFIQFVQPYLRPDGPSIGPGR